MTNEEQLSKKRYKVVPISGASGGAFFVTERRFHKNVTYTVTLKEGVGPYCTCSTGTQLEMVCRHVMSVLKQQGVKFTDEFLLRKSNAMWSLKTWETVARLDMSPELPSATEGDNTEMQKDYGDVDVEYFSVYDTDMDKTMLEPVVGLSRDQKGRECSVLLQEIQDMMTHERIDDTTFLMFKASLRRIAADLTRAIANPSSATSGESRVRPLTIRNPEAARKRGRPDEGGSQTAHFRALNGKKPGAKKTKGTYTCTNCGQQGHRGSCPAVCKFCHKQNCTRKGEACRKVLKEKAISLSKSLKRTVPPHPSTSDEPALKKQRVSPPQ